MIKYHISTKGIPRDAFFFRRDSIFHLPLTFFANFEKWTICCTVSAGQARNTTTIICIPTFANNWSFNGSCILACLALTITLLWIKDIKKYKNDVFTSFYDLINTYNQGHFDIHTLARHLNTFSHYYIIFCTCIQQILVSEYESLGLCKDSWVLITIYQFRSLNLYWDYEQIF